MVAALAVSLPPGIVTQPASQTVLAGMTATFTIEASGTPPLGYRWRFNGANLSEGGPFSGTASSNLAIAGAQPANGEVTPVVR